jgi:uncharacterized protein YeaO (DUF488 family)
MAIRIVRLGAPRQAKEGPRLGTVRRPPRGVKKQDYARLDYYDQWLPDLAPSAALFEWARSAPLTAARWLQFARRYRREMQAPAADRLIRTLAIRSSQADFSVGCYCEDESRCHRSLQRQLLADPGAIVA